MFPVEHKPIGNAACSQLYCQECVKDQTKCPHCRNSVAWQEVAVTPSSQRFLFKPLSELLVICPGCKGRFAREHIKYHLSDCPIGIDFFIYAFPAYH